MKKVQVLLLLVILGAIAGKVNYAPAQQADIAALSTETNLEHVQQFFKYKVNHIQSNKVYRVRSCSIETAVCCHT
ncbi:hypothetical protein GCM10023115_40310 [Pontixanthobacter gangjinensis]|uniref:Uncharacterized protein n=1 Tax=Christiangramia aestuarii TaxID=1028746 RepID=A0A7K1LRZ8_9FLAO|nr:hypothetical protein [Christiangramia aestuarii]MUP43584.1 hypothetical protein [Christiangramia aestuarii]